MNESRNESRRAQVASHVERLAFDAQEIERLFLILDHEGSFDPPAGAFSVAFVSKTEICDLHQRFLDDPSPTDVITFPGDQDENLAGEICVCPEVASEYARLNQGDLSEELTLYIVHGYLHLCGFDDLQESEREEMRRAEKEAMDLLNNAHALVSFTLS